MSQALLSPDIPLRALSLPSPWGKLVDEAVILLLTDVTFPLEMVAVAFPVTLAPSPDAVHEVDLVLGRVGPAAVSSLAAGAPSWA